MIKRFFYTVKQAFLQVLRNRAMSLASIFAITAMLLILSLFFILVINVNTAAQTIQQDYDSIEVYLKDDVTCLLYTSLTGILENADSDKAGLFVQRYLRLFGFSKMKDSAVFVPVSYTHLDVYKRQLLTMRRERRY